MRSPAAGWDGLQGQAQAAQSGRRPQDDPAERPAIDGRTFRRLRFEAEVIASLDHPNIVPIYDIGEHLGRLTSSSS